MQKLFYSNGPPIFTARKRSCGEVMFLHLSVILFTGWACMAKGWVACVVKEGICMVKGDMHGEGG